MDGLFSNRMSRCPYPIPDCSCVCASSRSPLEPRVGGGLVGHVGDVTSVECGRSRPVSWRDMSALVSTLLTGKVPISVAKDDVEGGK